MRSLDELFAGLASSEFRRGFRLRDAEKTYLQSKGLELVLSHADDFINQRLALAEIANDGKQTPFRGHPVFVAQHATATCCRGVSATMAWYPCEHRLECGRERLYTYGIRTMARQLFIIT
jgi:hypothetical protein